MDHSINVVRRLDHVAIVVLSTETALRYFRDRLGLAVVSSERVDAAGVCLTYLDCGNAYIQLVEPLDPGSEIARFLDRHGEGIHHICFAVDDVPDAVAQLTGGEVLSLGTGRGRVSAFLPGPPPHGVRLECTEFRREEDADGRAGWLVGPSQPDSAQSRA